MLKSFEVIFTAIAFAVSCFTTPYFSPGLLFIPVLASIMLNYGIGEMLFRIYRKRLHQGTHRSISRENRDRASMIPLSALSLLLALAGGINFFLFSLIMLSAAFLYARNLRSLGLFRNLASAFIGSSVFVLSSLYTGQAGLSPTFFPLFLFFIMAREMVKDCTAMKEDMEDSLHTFPIQYGVQKAMTAAYAFVLAGLLIALCFNAFWNYKPSFMALPFIMLLLSGAVHIYRRFIDIERFRLIVEGFMMLFLAGALASSLI